MIKKITSLGAILGILALSPSVFAVQVIPGGMANDEGDAKAGKAKSEMCHGCHGVDGISLDPTTFPNLAGQYAGYIYKQVKDYQLGNRQDDTMSAMAQMVTSEQDLRDISVYFQSLKKMKATSTNTALAKKGGDLYTKGNIKSGVYGCVNCHGKNGKGKGDNSLFPVIGGQQKAYLVKQLLDMKSGKRQNDPAGMMMDIAKKMTDQEIEAVSEYLAGR
ncbi:MAG: c-type cytochrome [Gammaproteobacteria bacterium]|nr:c-type cytochrome [Gammaproteobacteria bacterium]